MKPIAESRLAMEAWRLRAIPLLEAGAKLAAIAKKFKVSRTTASRWRRDWKQTGSLAARKAPGRPRALTAEQEQKVRELLLQRPRLTTYRVAMLIKEQFGVLYSADHAGRLRHQLLGTKPRLRRRSLEGV